MKIKISTILFLSAFVFVMHSTGEVTTKDNVYIIPIKGTIELGLSGVVKRAVEEAIQSHAVAIILEIDTYGGRVDAADEICGYLKDAEPIPVIAFVTEEAWSAGALISLACREIYMAPGSSIGAAEPRMGVTGGEKSADEKMTSALRAKFKSIAEENGYPFNIAQGMVDKDLEIKKVKIKNEEFILTSEEIEEKKTQYKKNEITIIKTVKSKGKLITLTADEARELKLASAIVKNRGELLSLKDLNKYAIVEVSPTWSEDLVRFLTNPITSSILITLGILGIVFELMHPGWGVSAAVAVVCLSLFFWGHYLIGMAEWFEILLFIAGIILLLLEVLVIPGFGITGVLGILFTVASIFLAMVKYPNPFNAPAAELWGAFYTIAWSVIIVFVVMLGGIKYLPESRLWKRIILSAVQEKEDGYRVGNVNAQNYSGKTGKTASILRPSGRAVFDNETLDVITEGEFIDKDTMVKVVRIDGNKIVVTKWS